MLCVTISGVNTFNRLKHLHHNLYQILSVVHVMKSKPSLSWLTDKQIFRRVNITAALNTLEPQNQDLSLHVLGQTCSNPI